MEALIKLNKPRYLRYISEESAKMSYPGSMARGKKPVLTAGAKEEIQLFLSQIDLSVFDCDEEVDYKKWHLKHARKLAKILQEKKLLGNIKNEPIVVASKFIDTFMYSLLKYREFENLRTLLYLPFDGIVLRKIKSRAFSFLKSKSIEDIKKITGNKNAYELTYKKYEAVQEKLMDLISEINKKSLSFKFKSRIQLNILWSMK